MAAAKARRLILLAAIIVAERTSAAYEIPDVTIKVLKPKGLEASIPDVTGLTFFAFNGHVNRAITNDTVGSLRGEVLHPEGGRWVFKAQDVQLKAGDVINYYVFVTHNGGGALKDKLRYTVTEADVSSTPSVPGRTEPTECKPSLTNLRGARACSGQVIFEDHFNDLRPDLWQVEQYIPIANPEYPFVSYQTSAVSVSDGYLRITPTLQQSMPGFTNESINSGSLDLFSGCTASADACYRQASGPDILPPVASGRVSSAGLAFTYGTVHVRAKLPQGDWIYPEILLEPYLRKYGRSNYASGVIRIAAARGNKELRAGPDEYGNKVLYGGCIMDFQCRYELLRSKFSAGDKLWGNDFHEYSVKWTPEEITLSVDGEEWFRVEASTALRERFPARCSHLPRMLLARGTNMAPFDDYFFLTLGVAVGGISEFRDGTYSNGVEKPWTDVGRKAMLHFWEHQASWHPTWTQPELLVDYVKVVAL